MNSFTYLFIIVPVCYSLTLNEKGIQRDSTLATSGTSFATHSQQVPVRKLREGTLNVAESLAQLRAEIDKAGLTRDSGDMTHLLENSTHVEAEAIKSLLFSSASSKKNENQKTIQQDFKRGSVHSAWAQSGGGCHSAISQYGMVFGYSFHRQSLVKKFVQGERFTKASLQGTSTPLAHTTSSGGTWMWVSLLAYATSGSNNLHSTRGFHRRNGIGWIDAIVLPNEDPQQWGKILQHFVSGDKNSAFQRKEDAGMKKYEAMIENALHFYINVAEDPSLRNLDMQEIVEAELAAEVSKGGPEVQAIAAQYDITPTSHPLLLAAMKKVQKTPWAADEPLDQNEFNDCNIMDPSELAFCNEEIKAAIFGPVLACVRKSVESSETPLLWTWVDVGYKKFMKPYGLGPDDTFSVLTSPAPLEAWEIITTKAPVSLNSEPQLFGKRVQEHGGVLSGDLKIADLMGESGNWGLSAFYLLYYTSVSLKCVPQPSGLIKYANEKNLTTRLAKRMSKSFHDLLTAKSILENAMSTAMDVAPTNAGAFLKQLYYFPLPPYDQNTVYFDGASADNVGLKPLLLMIGFSGSDNFFADEFHGKVSTVTPTILVTSTGNDNYDFQAVASYFSPQVERRYAPPSLEMMMPFDLLCGVSVGDSQVSNTNYLLEPSDVTFECLNVGNCKEHHQVWSQEAPCEEGKDNVWSKLKKSGILFLPRTFHVAKDDSGTWYHPYLLKAATIALSVGTEMSFSFMTLFPKTIQQEQGEATAWSKYVSLSAFDDEMENFPTFPASSLMAVPLKYAFALMQYMTHIAFVQLSCLGTASAAFAQSHRFMVPCEFIRCEESQQYGDHMIFPVM